MGAKANRKILRQCLDGIAVTDFLDPTEFLKKLYAAAKEKIAEYNLLSFAEDLGFGQSPQLRMMMSGQRSLTVKAARKIADSLWMHGDVRHYFMTLVEYVNARRSEDRDRFLRLLTNWKNRVTAKPIDERLSRYLSHWLNPVLRELVAAGNASSDVEEIRKALNFPVLPAEVREAIDLLVELKMLRYTKGTAALAPTGGDVVTNAEVSELAAAVYHQAMLQIAKESITRIPQAEREVTGITLSLPRSAMAEIKAKTAEFLDYIQSLETRESTKDEPRDVYQVNVQAFPFTKVNP